MVTVLGFVQIFTSIALIVLVLMHSGKGGGISDMFGGGGASAAAGSTVVEKNLNRITLVLALVFAFNTVALGLIWTT